MGDRYDSTYHDLVSLLLSDLVSLLTLQLLVRYFTDCLCMYSRRPQLQWNPSIVATIGE